MTALIEHRSGHPSQIHEDRAAVLSTIATLADFTTTMRGLPDGSIPDVLQLRPNDGVIFVGDAKATETPGNRETFERLCHYADFIAGWVSAGDSAVLALAVQVPDAYGWLRVVRDLGLRVTPGEPVNGRVDLLDMDTAIVWQSYSGTRVELDKYKTS